MDQVLKEFLERLYFPKHIASTIPKKELAMALPFLEKFSMSFSTRL